MQNMFWSSWSLSMNPSSLHRLLRDLATVPGWYEKLFNAASDNIGMAEADNGVSVHDSVSRLLFTWWSSTSTPATFSHMSMSFFAFALHPLLSTCQRTSDSNGRTSADKYQVDWWRTFRDSIVIWSANLRYKCIFCSRLAPCFSFELYCNISYNFLALRRVEYAGECLWSIPLVQTFSTSSSVQWICLALSPYCRSFFLLAWRLSLSIWSKMFQSLPFYRRYLSRLPWYDIPVSDSYSVPSSFIA